ncbi:MAG: restriction endonuclease [Hyphomicrobiales bacterium]
MQPVLHALMENSRDMRFGPLMKAVGARLGLTAEELSARLPSGSETVFANRLQWALAYLERSGAVEERQGRWRPARAERDEARPASPPDTQAAATRAAAPSPDSVIAASARVIHQRLARELLDRIHGARPDFFEHLIIELLHAMGYGCRRDLSRHLGRSGDGGLDGAVPQDVLGLDVIYIQAKRYRPGSAVPVSAVREFAGSLDGRKARKGVFVTTATFPKSAASFVSTVPSKIALIDGQALADLLIRYDIGVKVRETYEVKQIDETRLAAALHRSRPQGDH